MIVKKWALYFTREELKLLNEGLSGVKPDFAYFHPTKHQKLESLRATIKLMSEAPDDTADHG